MQRCSAALRKTFSLRVSKCLVVGRAACTTVFKFPWRGSWLPFLPGRCEAWSRAALGKSSVCAQLSFPDGALGLSVFFGPLQHCQSVILGFTPCFA